VTAANGAAPAARRSTLDLMRELSVPLIGGAVVAMLVANLFPDWYKHAIHWRPFGDASLFGYGLDLHFLVNDVFMALFFGIAAKEITEACLPGGNLNPPRKAMNPLLATLGGVAGPAIVFTIGLSLAFQLGVYAPGEVDRAVLSRGWGVPTATDIALAWLVARTVFGQGHPAVDFLLLLAIADDAIGLVIIAIFYGDPSHPTEPIYLLLCLAGMGIAWGLRRAGVKRWLPYVALGGPLAWTGLALAHLHAALALVMIVPLMPPPKRDVGFFSAEDEVDVANPRNGAAPPLEHSPLHMFSHDLKLFVDLGLFFFAFVNAGVELTEVGPMTWLILGALVVGKTVGITLLGLVARLVGFPLPAGMGFRELAMAGFIGALGLTVALFVATAAFPQPDVQGEAKMGALFSAVVGPVAIAIGRAIGLGKHKRG
jgi:NhaA family Na+:H+ antiporter